MDQQKDDRRGDPGRSGRRPLRQLWANLAELAGGNASGVDAGGSPLLSERWRGRQQKRVRRAVDLRPTSPRLMIFGDDTNIDARTEWIRGLLAEEGYELIGYTRRVRSPFFLVRQLVFRRNQQS